MKTCFCKILRSALMLGLVGGATSVLADNGFYVGADGGLNLANDLTVSSGSLSLNPGVRGDGSAGYRFGLGGDFSLGLQAEVGIMYNTLDKANPQGSSSVSANGSYTQVPILGDALFKWNFHPHWFAYAGAGAGCDVQSLSINSAGGVTVNSSSSETDFAWQIMGGAGYQLGPSEISLGYKYLAVKPSGLQTVGNNMIFASYTFTF
jgi:opacity protein-like surface antigen